jgi:hypothetical protein
MQRQRVDQFALLAAIKMAAFAEDDLTAPLTIFASRLDGVWTENSPAVVLNNSSSGRAEDILPEDPSHMEYFLELAVVNEVVEGRESQMNVSYLDDDEIARTVIYYAENDTWPPIR